jgi:hypothetical protein
MPYVFSPELWDPNREMYVFRCHPATRFERWTFYVSESTLKQLDPRPAACPMSVFERCRVAIYQAALCHMYLGDPDVEQVLTFPDFNDAAMAPAKAWAAGVMDRVEASHLKPTRKSAVADRPDQLAL